MSKIGDVTIVNNHQFLFILLTLSVLPAIIQTLQQKRDSDRVVMTNRGVPQGSFVDSLGKRSGPEFFRDSSMQPSNLQHFQPTKTDSTNFQWVPVNEYVDQPPRSRYFDFPKKEMLSKMTSEPRAEKPNELQTTRYVLSRIIEALQRKENSRRNDFPF